MGSINKIGGSKASKAYKYLNANRDLIQPFLHKFPDGSDVGLYTYWRRVCYPLFQDKEIIDFANEVKKACKYSEQTGVVYQVIKTIYKMRFEDAT